VLRGVREEEEAVAGGAHAGQQRGEGFSIVLLTCPTTKFSVFVDGQTAALDAGVIQEVVHDQVGEVAESRVEIVQPYWGSPPGSLLLDCCAVM
jgi:hypothetical protein